MNEMVRQEHSPFTRTLVAAGLSVLTTMATTAEVPMGFEFEKVVLYQPDSVLEERVPDSDALADYLRQQRTACEEFFEEEVVAETLDVVTIIVPGKRARVWFVSSRRSSEDDALRSLRRLLEGITPPVVQSGPVAIALSGGIAGALRESSPVESFTPPLPREWAKARDALKEEWVMVPDNILDAVWPDHEDPN